MADWKMPAPIFNGTFYGQTRVAKGKKFVVRGIFRQMYVMLPDDHPAVLGATSECDICLDVNGGCTFLQKSLNRVPADPGHVWIGWDYNHNWDSKLTANDAPTIVKDADDLVTGLIAKY